MAAILDPHGISDTLPRQETKKKFLVKKFMEIFANLPANLLVAPLTRQLTMQDAGVRLGNESDDGITV